MALDPDVAGELARYIKLLKKSLEDVRQDLSKLRMQMRVEAIQTELLAGLTPEEQDAVQPFLRNLDLTELQAERDLLVIRRDALAKAITLLEQRLHG